MSWHFYTPTVQATIGTALPSNPVDGQEFTLVDSLSAPTYAWLLRYIAAKSSNKWQFIGGAPIIGEVVTSETTASTAYAALATAGPTAALPVAGDYEVALGCRVSSAPATIASIFMSYDIGGTGAVDADAASMTKDNSANQLYSMSRVRKKTGLTAVTLTAKYRITAGTAVGFQDRWLRVIPIAIGG